MAFMLGASDAARAGQCALENSAALVGVDDLLQLSPVRALGRLDPSPDLRRCRSAIPRIFREPRQRGASDGAWLHMIESTGTAKPLVSEGFG
jgi:hypothetical protein